MNEKKCGFVLEDETQTYKIIDDVFNNDTFVIQTKTNIKKYIDEKEQSALKICKLINSYA